MRAVVGILVGVSLVAFGWAVWAIVQWGRLAEAIDTANADGARLYDFYGGHADGRRAR